MMPKPKLYFQYEVPTSVVMIEKAVCTDYRRRENKIKYSTITGTTLARCVELNAIIDKALEEVEVGARGDMLCDICTKRGYDSSPCGVYMGKNTYYRRKRKLIYDIAKSLSLL